MQQYCTPMYIYIYSWGISDALNKDGGLWEIMGYNYAPKRVLLLGRPLFWNQMVGKWDGLLLSLPHQSSVYIIIYIYIYHYTSINLH